MSKNLYKLLVEQPTYEVKYVIEEKNRQSPSTLHISGPFLMANEANRNNRVYPLDEMVKEVSRYTTEMVYNQRAVGELNHPQSPEINLERICHMVTELKQDGNIFVGKSKVLNHGLGGLLKGLIMDGVKLGVSSRALGKLDKDGSHDRVTDFKLVAIDVVADPSVPTAFVNGILEGKQWVLNESGQFENYYDNFEKAISKLPLKNKDEFLKEQIVNFINSLKSAQL